MPDFEAKDVPIDAVVADGEHIKPGAESTECVRVSWLVSKHECKKVMKKKERSKSQEMLREEVES